MHSFETPHDRRAFLRAAVGSASAFATAGLVPSAWAQGAYPSKPITLIVAYPPGGNTDLVARIFAAPLGKALNQTVIVDNRAGAGGMIGVTAASKAAADGYTMVIGDMGSLCINRFAHANLPYNPTKDFVPISTTATVSILVTGRPDLPASTFKEFLALARAKPGEMKCGTAGVGTIGHLSLEMLKSMTGLDIMHVPYKGGAPALTDLVGGHIDLLIDGTAFSHAKAGKVKALAATGDRIAAMPQVPTMAEAGVPGFHFQNFWGYLMPANTSAEIVNRISMELQRIAAMPEIRQQLEQGGIAAKASTPKEFGDLIARNTEQIGQIVKRSKIDFQS